MWRAGAKAAHFNRVALGRVPARKIPHTFTKQLSSPRNGVASICTCSRLAQYPKVKQDFKGTHSKHTSNFLYLVSCWQPLTRHDQMLQPSLSLYRFYREYKYKKSAARRDLPWRILLSLLTRDDTLRSMLLSPKSTTMPPMTEGLTWDEDEQQRKITVPSHEPC